ncbi:MAG: transglycosylase domain-containing protein [Holophagales bacterium]|nr:transglycosylase domain-containing protein [Holophagales bacterium]
MSRTFRVPGVSSAVLRAALQWRLWLAAITVVVSCALLTTLMALVHTVYFDRTGLPDVAPFLRFELPSTGRIQDERGELLVEMALQYRRVLRYQEIPPVLQNAILSAEDKNFFTHSGVDYGALVRVLGKTARRSLGGRRLVLSQGGSTVTQQLVRGYFLPDLVRDENEDVLVRHSFLSRLMSGAVGATATNKLLRKVEEMRLSFWLETELARRLGSRRRAKEEILARYASLVYLGNGRYGFEAASQYYFGRPLASFTEEDAPLAAFLAGMTKSPSEAARSAQGLDRPGRRHNEILALMARNGFLSAEQVGRFQVVRVRTVAPRLVKTEAPAIVESALIELAALSGQDGATVGLISVPALVMGRIHVTSTADLRIQRIVNLALESGLGLFEGRHRKSRGEIQGSVVVLRNSDAAILAEAGGREVFRDRPGSYGDFNRARDSRRQPGSAMKPFVYLAALRRGALTLDELVPDEPVSVDMGEGKAARPISNYDGEFKGLLPLRQALAESRNAVAIWIVNQVGIRAVLETASSLGIQTPLVPNSSTALGASEVTLVELANAYRAIASGLAAEPHVLGEVLDSSGRMLWKWSATPRTIDMPLALIQEGLRGVVRLPSGTAHSLSMCRQFPIQVMGKTGTTSGYRDALFVGSTYGPGGITVAVRIGYDGNQELGQRETGTRAALPIFREIVGNVYRDELAGPIPRFPSAIERGIDTFLASQAASAAASAIASSLTDSPGALPRAPAAVALTLRAETPD